MRRSERRVLSGSERSKGIDDEKTSAFKVKLADIQKTLSTLHEKGALDSRTYADFVILSWTARTMDQLDAIVHDLAEISKGFQ